MTFKRKQNLLAIAAISCLATLAGGCASSSASKPIDQANAKPSAVVETKTIDKTTETSPKSIATASSEDKVGVLECDEYIAKYESCVTGKVPEASRAVLQSSIEQTRKTWKGLAANPQTKAALAGTCKQMQETSKPTMQAYGCEW